MNYLALLIEVFLVTACFTVTGGQESNCIVDSLRQGETSEYYKYRGLNEGYCCLNIFDSWFQRNIVGDYYGRPMKKKRQISPTPDPRLNITYEATDKWNSICKRWKAAATCVNSLAPECSIDSAYSILRNRTQLGRYSEYNVHRIGGTAFHDRACDNGELKASLKAAIETTDMNITCLNNTERIQFISCSRQLENELRYGEIDMYMQYNGLKDYFDRLAENTLRCKRAVILSSSCNEQTRDVLMHIARFQLPSIFNISLIDISNTPDYDFTAEERCTVGVYGDPHLRVCWSEYLQTCSAPGMQEYLSNTVFSIYGENRIVASNGATNLKYVRITFKTMDGTQELGSYTATNYTLPETFDGNVTILGTGDDEVVILEASVYRQVIMQKGLGLILVIRRWSDNYFFTLRMAENAINESTGLLSAGCPQDQLIRRGRWVGDNNSQRRAKRAVSSECAGACAAVSDTEFKEICEFDCTLTGDVEYANVAIAAITDVTNVVLDDEELRGGAVPPATEAPTTSKPGKPWHWHPFWRFWRYFKKFLRG